MTITLKQIIDGLLAVASDMNEQLYEFKSENADDYNQQIQEIYEQYESIKK